MKRLAAIVGALLILPSAASADSFSATFAGTGLGAAVKGTFVNNGVQKTFDVFAGQLKWKTDVDEFLSFCLQLDSPLLKEQEFGTSVPGHVQGAASQIAKLVGMQFSKVSNPWEGAGLQLAIWNLIYDGDLFADSGTFSSTTKGIASIANAYLAELAAYSGGTGQVAFLDSYPDARNAKGQDQVTYSTPEPGTLLLLGAGAAALAVRRRLQRAS